MEINASRSIVFGGGTDGTALLSGSGATNRVVPMRMNFTVYQPVDEIAVAWV